MQLGIQKHLGLNRFKDDGRAETEISGRIGMKVLGSIPEDNNLNEYDRAGKPLLQLPADSPSLAAVRKILQQIVPGFIRS